MSDELLEVKPEFMGFPRADYPGAFPSKVEDRIKVLAQSPCLHLFSGTSKIGDVRVDIERPEATLNMNVLDFMREDKRVWKFVVADPPYEIRRAGEKLKAYGIKDSVTGTALYQKVVDDYLRKHAENVLWFDMWSPCPHGFYRYKVWVYLSSDWHRPRILTWLKREGERLA